MAASVDYADDVLRMILAIARRRPDVDDTALAITKMAVEPTPAMALGYLNKPAIALSIANSAFYMLIRMFRPSHPSPSNIYDCLHLSTLYICLTSMLGR